MGLRDPSAIGKVGEVGCPWPVELTVFSAQLDEGPVGEPEGTFVDYQTTMVKTAKAIAVTVQEMVSQGCVGGGLFWGHLSTVPPPSSLCAPTNTPLLPGHQVYHQPRRAGHIGQPAHQ